MGILTSVGLLGIVLLSMVACNEADGPELLASPHLPQQREDMDVMDADLEGELVLEDGCLRGISKGGTDYFLIWPHGFKLSVDGPDIRISDDSGLSLSVGEEIRIGGGEVPLAHVQTLVEQPVPDDCPGPYWVVGEVPIPTGAQESSGPVAQIQQQPTPTSTPSPRLPGSITPVPASERYRLDLGGDVVVAFVEGLSPEHSGKVATSLTCPPALSLCWTGMGGRSIGMMGEAIAQAAWTRFCQTRWRWSASWSASRTTRTPGPAKWQPTGSTRSSSAVSPTQQGGWLLDPRPLAERMTSPKKTWARSYTELPSGSMVTAATFTRTATPPISTRALLYTE